MHKKLILENFRYLKKTEIGFRDLNIIVGKNNAGKSTLIEALRILPLVIMKSKKSNYISATAWLK